MHFLQTTFTQNNANNYFFKKFEATKNAIAFYNGGYFYYFDPTFEPPKTLLMGILLSAASMSATSCFVR